jgi:hypothetical protein
MAGTIGLAGGYLPPIWQPIEKHRGGVHLGERGFVNQVNLDPLWPSRYFGYRRPYEAEVSRSCGGGVPRNSPRREGEMNEMQGSILSVSIRAIFVCALMSLAHGAAVAQTAPLGASPRIYIEPQEGFESYIAAAIVKKKVPAVVTHNKEEAIFVLSSAVISKEESTGSKIARCLFAYCAGIGGSQTATVQLVKAKTQEVAWAYNVRKGDARAYQSSAEAIAKHLKTFLEEHPQ